MFGRFKFVRFAYRYFNLIKKSNIKYSHNNHVEIFAGKNEIQRHIKKNGFYPGIKLKEQTVDKIMNLVNDSKLVSNRPSKDINNWTEKDLLTFKTLEEVNLYNKNNPTPVCLVNVVGENLKKICEEIFFTKNYYGINY